MAREYSPIWPILDQTKGEREKKEREEKRKESCRESDTTFSLIFSVIGPAVLSGARGRVHPHGKSFTTRPELRSFDKFREVGVLFYSLAKSHSNG